jgi:hypothetical protein
MLLLLLLLLLPPLSVHGADQVVHGALHLGERTKSALGTVTSTSSCRTRSRGSLSDAAGLATRRDVAAAPLASASALA